MSDEDKISKKYVRFLVVVAFVLVVLYLLLYFFFGNNLATGIITCIGIPSAIAIQKLDKFQFAWEGSNDVQPIKRLGFWKGLLMLFVYWIVVMAFSAAYTAIAISSGILQIEEPQVYSEYYDAFINAVFSSDTLLTHYIILSWFGVLVSGFIVGKLLRRYKRPIYYSLILSMIFALIDAILSVFFYENVDAQTFLKGMPSLLIITFLSILGTKIALIRIKEANSFVLRTIVFISVILTFCLGVFVGSFDIPEKQVDFNSFNNDLRIVTAFNYSRDSSSGDNVLWKAFMPIVVGDGINFRFYYHNTSKNIAHNTRLHLNVTTIGRFIIGSGFITCDNSKDIWSNTSIVYVYGCDSVSTTLNSVRWFPNKSKIQVKFPYDQTGEELFSKSGLLIGDVFPAKDWQKDAFDNSSSVVVAIATDK